MSRKDDFDLFKEFGENDVDFKEIKRRTIPEKAAERPRSDLKKIIPIGALACILIAATVLSVIFIPFANVPDQTANVGSFDTSDNAGDTDISADSSSKPDYSSDSATEPDDQPDDSSVPDYSSDSATEPDDQEQVSDIGSDDPIFERPSNVYLSDEASSALYGSSSSGGWADASMQIKVLVCIDLFGGGYDEYDELMELIRLKDENAAYRPQVTALITSIMDSEEAWLKTLGFQSVVRSNNNSFILTGTAFSIRKIFDGRLNYDIYLQKEVGKPSITASNVYGRYTAIGCVCADVSLNYMPSSDERGNLRKRFSFEVEDGFTVTEVAVDRSAENYYGFSRLQIVYGLSSAGCEFKSLMISDYKKFEIRDNYGGKIAAIYANSQSTYLELGHIYKVKKGINPSLNIVVDDYCGDAHFDIVTNYEEWQASPMQPDNVEGYFFDKSALSGNADLISVKRYYYEAFFTDNTALLVINYGLFGYVKEVTVSKLLDALTVSIDQDYGEWYGNQNELKKSNYLCVDLTLDLLDGVTKLNVEIKKNSYPTFSGTAVIDDGVIELAAPFPVLDPTLRVDETGRRSIYIEGDGWVADSELIFTMTREATLEFLDYTPEHFSDVNAIQVRDLTGYTVDYVRKKLAGEPVDREMAVDVDKFLRILHITITGSGGENLRRALEILDAREDVLNVSYNHGGGYSLD